MFVWTFDYEIEYIYYKLDTKIFNSLEEIQLYLYPTCQSTITEVLK